jgi:hypothetical protein
MVSHQHSPKKTTGTTHQSTTKSQSHSVDQSSASIDYENPALQPQQILQLQSLIGNQAVMRLLDTEGSASSPSSTDMFLQRTSSGNSVIQRDGENNDQYTILKDETMSLMTRKQTFTTEIKQLQAAHDTEKDRKKRRKIRVRLSKLERKAARLQYRIDNLIERMKPLYKAEEGVDKIFDQQKEKRGTELKDLGASGGIEKAKKELEAEKKRKQDEEDKKYKTYAEMEALSMADLKKYITETPNWHMRSTHSDEQKKDIEDIHALTLEAGTLAALGSFTVASLVSETGTMVDKLANLRDFIKAVKNDDPFPLSVAPDLTTANKRGEALKKLKAGFPNYVLNSAMKKEQYFNYLIQYNLVDDVVKYYNTASSKPIFQADNGADFLSYIVMRVNHKKDPLAYDGTVLQGKIRNFHRFEPAALDQLIQNYGEKGVRPLTLVLHSSIDHNGAFHRDPKMTAVFKNSKINALMIEGGETLGEYKSQIGPLAKEYGVYGKIDQVMFAGHGGSQIIEMAGSVKEGTDGKLKQVDNPIDLQNDKTEADKLFDEVLKNMEETYDDDFIGPQLPKQQNRRILFNACLTNSNAVENALSGDLGKAKKEIADYLKNNASLATYLGERAKSQGRDVKSLGANASITQFDMIENSGELTMKSTVDPKVAASKLEYAEEGHEPLGTLRAALESWADDEATTLQAMTRRSAWGSTTWDDVIIESMYTEVLKSGEVSNSLANYISIAHEISSLKQESHCSVDEGIGMVQYLGDDMLDPVFDDLVNSDEWAARKFIPLVMYQLWMEYFASEESFYTGILSQLDQHFDVKTARKFIDIGYLAGAGQMDPMLKSGGSNKGKLILSLIGALDSGEAESKKYLKSIMTAESPEISGLPKVDEVPEVAESDPPRSKVPKVPAAPGRAEVKEILDKRLTVAAILELAELPELAAVGAKSKSKAPGRPGRPERAEVAKVPKVDAHFAKLLDVTTLLAGTGTEQEIVDLVK